MKRTLFIVLQILLLPITLLGYLIFVISLANTARTTETEMPQNLASPLLSRWFMHKLRVRTDAIAMVLSHGLRDYLPAKLKLVVLPTIIASRISGHVPARFRFPKRGKERYQNWNNASTEFIDDIIVKNKQTTQQVVILPAGLCTRSFKFFQHENIPVFEIDREQILAQKKEAFLAAKVSLQDIHYIGIQKQEEWKEALLHSNFDPHKNTLFVIESSSYYMQEEQWKVVLNQIHGTCKGSVRVVFDFLDSAFLASPYLANMQRLEGENLFWKNHLVHGIPLQEHPKEILLATLQNTGFQLESYRFFGRQKAIFAGVAEISASSN